MPLYLAQFSVTTHEYTPIYAATQNEADEWMRTHEKQVCRRDARLRQLSTEGATVAFLTCLNPTKALIRKHDIEPETLCWGPREEEEIEVSRVWPRDRLIR